MLVPLLLAVSACDRGWLAGWLASKSLSPLGGGESPRVLVPGPLAPSRLEVGGLGGTDCSDGLSRCADGRIEVSLSSHVPYPCAASEVPGSCACPWQATAACPGACVLDGLEVLAHEDVARVQLCAPLPTKRDAGVRRSVPIEEAEPKIAPCADEGISCAKGIVRSCESAGALARVVVVCRFGCAPGIVVEPGDLLTNDGAEAILCRRVHAERE